MLGLKLNHVSKRGHRNQELEQLERLRSEDTPRRPV